MKVLVLVFLILLAILMLGLIMPKVIFQDKPMTADQRKCINAGLMALNSRGASIGPEFPVWFERFVITQKVDQLKVYDDGSYGAVIKSYVSIFSIPAWEQGFMCDKNNELTLVNRGG